MSVNKKEFADRMAAKGGIKKKDAFTCNEIMKKKISMLRYFVALISTFNWSKSMRYCMENLQGKISTMSIEYISTQAGMMSQRTCIRYNDILSEMKMIYVYKSNEKTCWR